MNEMFVTVISNFTKRKYREINKEQYMSTSCEFHRLLSVKRNKSKMHCDQKAFFSKEKFRIQFDEKRKINSENP